jgi:hypothetical protein
MAGGDRDSGAGRSEIEQVPVAHEAVRIAVGRVMLEGDLDRPPGSSGTVLFAHGGGSSRHSPPQPAGRRPPSGATVCVQSAGRYAFLSSGLSQARGTGG